MQRRTRHHDLSVDEGIGDRRKVLFRVIGNGFVGELIERQRLVGQQANGIAVVCGIRAGPPGNDHGAARPVLDDDRLSEPLLQSIGQSAHENIAGAPGAVSGHDANGSGRIVFRIGASGGKAARIATTDAAERVSFADRPIFASVELQETQGVAAKIFSLSAAGISRSRISLMARGFSEVSGGASLP